MTWDIILRLARNLGASSFPVLLFLIAAILLFVAIGIDFVVGVNTTAASKWAAGVLGTIFFIAAFWLAVLGQKSESGATPPVADKARKAGDSFFRYYVVSAVIFTVLYWMIMAEFEGKGQQQAVKGLLLMTAAIALVVVLWRFFEVRRYVQRPEEINRPVGLSKGSHNLFLYFALLGPDMVLLLALTLHYTKNKPANEQYLMPILWYLVIFSAALAFVRFLWELADSQAD